MKKLSVNEDIVREVWSLIITREWPFSMMGSLSAVKTAFDTALDEAHKGEEEDKGANEA